MDAVKRVLIALHRHLASTPARLTVAALVAILVGVVGVPPWMVDILVAALQQTQGILAP